MKRDDQPITDRSRTNLQPSLEVRGSRVTQSNPQGRNTAAVLIAAVMLIGTAACDQVEQDLTAIRADGKSLLIAICEPFRSQKINIGERIPGGEWVDLWVEQTPMDLSVSSIIAIGPTEYPVAFSNDDGRPDLSPGTRIDILLTSKSDQEGSLTSAFEIGESGLSEEKWTSFRGELSDEPCGK